MRADAETVDRARERRTALEVRIEEAMDRWQGEILSRWMRAGEEDPEWEFGMMARRVYELYGALLM